MTLTSAEQYLVELINRARLDPAAEAIRFGASLNDDLDAGTIDASAKQVLSPNEILTQAATAHNQWMLDTDTFSHTGVNGSSPGERMANQGYEFTGSWTWRENLAWYGSTGAIDMALAIEEHHEGLYLSAGHRANTFAEDIREIGISQESGLFNNNGKDYNTSMLTEKFAASGDGVFVTGVAYRDLDSDNFYSIGEGQQNIWFKEGTNSVSTAAAGGYGMDVGAQGAAIVQIGKSGNTLAILKLDMTNGNAKVDLVTSASGVESLKLSVSTEITSGIGNAALLGVADLDLIGHNGSNVFYGNRGDNGLWGRGGNDAIYGASGDDFIRGGGASDRLFGGNGSDVLYGDSGNDILRAGSHSDDLFGGVGDDRLYGDAGRDTLLGGNGHDRLVGGADNDLLIGEDGNDKMRGGGGADKFVFHGGRDMVQDFTDDIDTIILSDQISGLEKATVADVLGMGVTQGNMAVFTFNATDRLIVNNVTDLDMLVNDLQIV